jgi:hypothetical protein
MSDSFTAPRSPPPELPTHPAPAQVAPAQVAPARAWRAGARWFAAEFLVVVAGVLVALAVQAWYEGRRDAARERAYLLQLAADLRDTERLLDTADVANRASTLAAARFVRAFYEPTRPPRDSVLAWYGRASSYETVRPVTGTVEALIVTGDLNLLRSDRARAAVSAYLDLSRRLVASQQTYEAEFLRASDALDEKIDYAETIPARVPPARIDSLARADPLFPIPPGPRRRPFPLDTDALLRDSGAHFAMSQLLSAKQNMARQRHRMRDAARQLAAALGAAPSRPAAEPR